MTLTTEQMAAALGISRQRLNELARKGKVPKLGAGQWDQDLVFAALKRNTDTRQKSPARERASRPHSVGAGGGRPAHRTPQPEKGTIAYAELVKKQAEAAIAMAKAKELEGTLVKADDVRAAVSNMITAAKNRLLTIGDELCDQLAATSDPIRCRELVADKIHEALSCLAEWPARA